MLCSCPSDAVRLQGVWVDPIPAQIPQVFQVLNNTTHTVSVKLYITEVTPVTELMLRMENQCFQNVLRRHYDPGIQGPGKTRTWKLRLFGIWVPKYIQPWDSGI